MRGIVSAVSISSPSSAGAPTIQETQLCTSILVGPGDGKEAAASCSKSARMSPLDFSKVGVITHQPSLSGLVPGAYCGCIQQPFLVIDRYGNLLLR